MPITPLAVDNNQTADICLIEHTRIHCTFYKLYNKSVTPHTFELVSFPLESRMQTSNSRSVQILFQQVDRLGSKSQAIRTYFNTFYNILPTRRQNCAQHRSVVLSTLPTNGFVPHVRRIRSVRADAVAKHVFVKHFSGDLELIRRATVSCMAPHNIFVYDTSIKLCLAWITMRHIDGASSGKRKRMH